jgi:hypothetical protein
MPAWLWGFLGFMFGLIGFLVFYVAEKRATRAAESKKRSSPPPPQWPPRVEVPATSAWPPAPPSAP